MMKILIFILFILTNVSLHSQFEYNENKLSDDVLDIVEDIEDINVLMDAFINYEGTTPEQWYNFEKLLQNANKDELIELTNYPNGVVRAYAFWALTQYENIDLFSIIKKHFNDNEKIDTQFGCNGGKQEVSDYFCELLFEKYKSNENKILFANELESLDSFLIYSNNNSNYKKYALQRAKLTDKLYNKVKELVIFENNFDALIVLSKFQKEQDKEIILAKLEMSNEVNNNLSLTFEAVCCFPDTIFFPKLSNILRKILQDKGYNYFLVNLYKAIATYKNQEAVSLFNLSINSVLNYKADRCHLEFMLDAILQFKDPIFHDLLWTLFDLQSLKTIDSYKYLLSLNPNRAFEYTKKQFRNDYIIKDTVFTTKIDTTFYTDNLHEFMLNVIYENDKEFAIQIIVNEILNPNVHTLSIYLTKVNKESVVIEAIFKRLLIETNPHIYNRFIELLLRHNDNELNQRILKIRPLNANLNQGWGSGELDYLLKKYNVK